MQSTSPRSYKSRKPKAGTGNKNTVQVSEEDEPLREAKAARHVGVNYETLRQWRRKGIGPRYFKAGQKLIRYRKADLDSWINARLSAPTSSAA